MMSKELLSLSLKSSYNLKKIFLSVETSSASVGVGILSSEFSYSLRFLNLPKLNDKRDMIILNQLSSMIFLLQHKDNKIKSYFKTGPIIFCINSLLKKDINFIDNTHFVPYYNTLFRILHNLNYNIEITSLHPSCYQSTLASRLAEYASNFNHNLGVDTFIKLHNGDRIEIRSLFYD